MTRRLAAIMFTDTAGFTSLAQTDEAEAIRQVREQEKLLRPLLKAHRGRKVKSLGDGFLLEFPDALDAVECGVGLQRRVRERNERGGERPLSLRVGIHLGDVQRRGTDILGDAVNIANRVQALADPGGVCLTEPVYFLVRNKLPYSLENLGLRSLKGVQEPLTLYRVALPWTVEVRPVETPSHPRLAVLPLANISPDPNDEYFADGLTEELISVLSQVHGLRVIARTSVNQYKATPKPVSQIGTELGVSSVLEGSVRKAGSRLRISLQLIDVVSQEHTWSETYNRDLEDVFAIQADVAERTASALKVGLLKSEHEALQERPTSSLAAYEFYLHGIQTSQRLWGSRMAEIDRETQEYFEAAIQKDPLFSAAYSHLAVHLIAVSGMTRPAREVLPSARKHVAKALELNPNSSDAHVAAGNLAMQADADWTRAEAEFQQAIALNPSSSAAHSWYGYLLAILQRFGEARKQDLSATELDPLWTLPKVQLILAHLYSGDFESATALCKQSIERYPTIREFTDTLAFIHAVAGQADQAKKLLGTRPRTSDLVSRIVRAKVFALLGNPREARGLLADLENGRLTEYVPWTQRAELYSELGETETALSLMESEYKAGDRSLWSNYYSFSFDRIRDNPRFIAMLRAMDLPTSLARPSREFGAGAARSGH